MWFGRFLQQVEAVRMERRRSDSAVFRRLHDAMPGRFRTWSAGGWQAARVSQDHVPWSRMPVWLKMLPTIYTLRDVLGWHASRWLYITDLTASRRRSGHVPEYVLRNNTTDPDGRFPWDPSDHQRLVEKYLGGEFSLASWSGLSAEGYWFYTQRINVPVMLHFWYGVRSKWTGIGFYTMRILLMIHREPQWLFRLSESELEEYFASDRWQRDICRGWCLRYEHLREDACRVLEDELGYRREDLERALALMPEKMNEAESGRKERATHALLGNETLCAQIGHAERLAHRYILPALTGTEPVAAAGPPVSASPPGAAVPSEASASSEA